MKQATHIFLKDVQRLWLQIALLMLAIGYFAWLDINASPFSNSSGNVIIEFIMGAMVWFLIARTVHEETVPGENQFWLTRPYDRGSLLGAKVLMAVCVVIIPLFLADCVILSVQSLGVIGNLGGLVLKQLLTATWLILPPLAIASVTRAITEDVLAWLVVFVAGSFAYFPRSGRLNEFQTAKGCAIAVALLLLVVALWHQYFRRGMIASRALIAAAVLIPALPIPESAALALAQLDNNSAAPDVRLTPKVESIKAIPWPNNEYCATIPISLQGVHEGWQLAVLNRRDTYESADKAWSVGWHESGWIPGRFSRPAELPGLSTCLTAEGQAALGSGKPLTLHASAVLGVFEETGLESLRARWEPFDVRGVGNCHFQHDFRSENYLLACKSALRNPPLGSVVIGTDETFSSAISNYQDSFAPMRLLAGVSPVYKWTTLPLDRQIRQAVETGEQIRFRAESRIAVIEREVTVQVRIGQ